MALTPLPPAPLISDSKTVFNEKASPFVQALGPMVNEINAILDEIAQVGEGLPKVLRTPEDIPTLPNAAGRSNRILGFNAGGDPAVHTYGSVRALLNVADGATANATNAQLRDRTTHTGFQAISTVTGLQSALDSKVDDSQIRTTLASPDNSSVPSTLAVASAIADSMAGETPQGAWNASTNTPALASSVGTAGYWYEVSVAGTTNLNGETGWQVGDKAIFNGIIWTRIPANAVRSVDGRTGAIILNCNTVADLTTALPLLPVGAVVSTKGCLSIGDGGDGVFDVVASTARAVDNYSVIGSTGKYVVLRQPFNSRQFGATGNSTTDDTSAMRRYHDTLLGILRTSGVNGVVANHPAGNYLVSDELFSDSFQELWWDQTNLGKGKHFTIRGAGQGQTTFTISSSWNSGVRNSTNGNERTYGPWAGQPSPSVMFPAIANVARTPAAMSYKDFKVRGAGRVGREPCVFFSAGELDAFHHRIHVIGASSNVHIVMGTFNSVHESMHYESNGFQPVESGSLLGGDAGFPDSRINFNLTSAGQLTAVARENFGSYVQGQELPIFTSAHIGKTVSIHRGASHNGVAQLLKATITAIGSGTPSTTATVAPQIVSTMRDVTNTSGSFQAVKFTSTAGSDSVTLSAPVKIGRGAADMLGMFVWLPKAGANVLNDTDIKMSRIVAVSNGSDSAGYSTITLASSVPNTVSDYFITSCAFAHTLEDDFGYNLWSMNDTDLTTCRYENSSGYGTDNTAGSVQMILQGTSGSVQLSNTKIHGANPDRGQFSAEVSCFFDNCVGLDFIGVGFTHFSSSGKGAVRFMGDRCKVKGSAVSPGSWQLPADYIAFSLEPRSVFDWADWDVDLKQAEVADNTFPVLSQKLFSSSGGNYEAFRLRNGRNLDDRTLTLDSTDDINNVQIAGKYFWGTSVPLNSPLYSANTAMDVTGLSPVGNCSQTLYDTDNRFILQRFRNGGVWGPFRNLLLRRATAGSIGAASNDINTLGKDINVCVINTTNSKMYYANGTLATDTWTSVDGADTITPA